MKKITLLSLAALLLAACSDDEGGVATDLSFHLKGSIRAEATGSSHVATRGNVQSTQIVENETVWAWVTDAGKSGEEAVLYGGEQLTAAAGGMLTGQTAFAFPQADSRVDIRAMHGLFAESNLKAAAAFPPSIGFRVMNDQRTGDNAYISSDLLYAAADNVGVQGGPTVVPLTFYHMLAKLELAIEVDAERKEDIADIAINDIALEGTFTPRSDADLMQQAERAAMIVPGEQKNMLTLGTGLNVDGFTNDAIVVPQPIGGKKITITFADGEQASHPFPAGWRFESGKRHVFHLKLEGKRIQLVGKVHPWDTSEGENEGIVTNPSPLSVGDYFYADGTYS